LDEYREPVQSSPSSPPFQFNGYTLTPVADFDVTARILSISRYHTDREANLAPYDFALGWKMMSNPKVLKDINISQSGRFYHWYTNDFPIPRADIESQSANMHLIPANDNVMNNLKNLSKDQIIRIKGHLVNISGNNFNWNSSVSRHDTGMGACEVIFVKEVFLKQN